MDLYDHDFDRPCMDWGIVIRDARSGDVLFEHGGEKVLNAASMGKLILLAFAGNELLRNPAVGDVRLDRHSVAPVGDSGIWRHLDIDELPAADAVKLVFLASDNLATNVLIDHFRLERVQAFGRQLGLVRTELLDIVRDDRRAGDPATFSRASAGELCEFMVRIAQGRVADRPLSDWLRQGLSLGMDLSMVPAPFSLDPLTSHDMGHDAVTFVANKTGTDAGIRADAGIIGVGGRETAYAAICDFDADQYPGVEALAGMHVIGKTVQSIVARSVTS